MKFPLSWLRDWVEPATDPQTLAERLTMAGHEVESLELEGGALDGVLVAEVLDVRPHPDADRLRICQVYDGEDEIEVVCGAPNVAQGMKAVFAPAGITLPDGNKLRRSKIRGVVSNGMLCSQAELGLGDDADGIVRLPDDAPAGEALGKYLGLPDPVFDLNLTPNRGDCFSMRGMARDVAAVTGSAFCRGNEARIEAVLDDVYPLSLDDPAACLRFAGRVIRDIDPTSGTPAWMSERLRRSGLRSITPVVDVTNYVMLETGQPLHAYDLDRLRGTVRPRFARAGEKLTLLDEREVTLDDATIVISDDSGPIGIGGIMGGLGTAVTESTRNVFLEAAFWPPAAIAGRARSYGLHTDASLRFERGVDPRGQAAAIERATELLLQIAGGSPGPVNDVAFDDQLPEPVWIDLRHARIRQVLGTELAQETVGSILRRLQMELEETGGGWRVRAPAFRFDIEHEDDLIEEVARIHGYDAIPEQTAMAAQPLAAVTEHQVDPSQIAATLVARDFSEVISYSFIDAATNSRFTDEGDKLALSNPISSEMAVMRGSLWPGMLEAAISNLARQQDRVRLFEIGHTYHGGPDAPEETLRVAGLATGPVLPEQWAADRRTVDFFDIKSDVEALLALTGAAAEFTFEPVEQGILAPGQAARVLREGRTVGVLGTLHPASRRELDIGPDVLLFELDVAKAFSASVPEACVVSRYPAVRRDLAVVVGEDVPAKDLVTVALSAAPDIIRRVVIFDVYRGPGIEAGLKSVALGLILQETSRTLTDDDADSVTAAAVRELAREYAAVLRD